MSVLMVGVDESTKGGMWTVVENYLNDSEFVEYNDLTYIPSSITGCSIPNRLFFTFIAYIKIIKAYKKKKYSILHIHMSERASIKRKGIIMKYGKKHGSKILLHMHGAEFEILYRRMDDTRKSSVRDILNLADKIIILGAYWKEFISSIVDDPKKVCVVYNAVTVPDEYKYNKNSNSILFLGAVSKRKGIEVFIQALKYIEDILKDKYIVNIYGPDVDGNIADLIKDSKLDKWVFYCGWLDKKSKPEVLANTCVNVLPSYNEGLPMTILEALSYGIPSITTSVAAIPEVINDKNGIIIDPGDAESLGKAIKKLVLNNEYRFELSKQSYKDAVNKFSVEKHISQIQEIYGELIK